MMQHLPWLLNFLYMIPGTTKNVDLLRKHSLEAVRRRKQEGSLTKDLFHHLVGNPSIESYKRSMLKIILNRLTRMGSRKNHRRTRRLFLTESWLS